MNRSIIFLILASAQICVAQEGDLNDTVPKKKKYLPQISGVIQVHYLNEFNTNGDNISDPDGFRILRARLTNASHCQGAFGTLTLKLSPMPGAKYETPPN